MTTSFGEWVVLTRGRAPAGFLLYGLFNVAGSFELTYHGLVQE